MRHNIPSSFYLILVILFATMYARQETLAGDGEDANVFLPFITSPLEVPALPAIENGDWDNRYNVVWQASSGGYFLLQEARNPDFTGAINVYSGYSSNWAVPDPGKLPGKYYYRVRSQAGSKYSAWSNVQSITINPIYVGLDLRWDGVGYLNVGPYYEVGSHLTKNFDAISSPGVVRARNRDWYNPDPLQFGETVWNEFYDVLTGRFLSSSLPGNPNWKWGASWRLGYTTDFVNGQTATIDGEKFTVTGPHSGHTAFGVPVNYWEFTNQERFLFYDDGGDWTQYVHPGDIRLRYDAGASRLMIYHNVLRRFYENGNRSSYTIQYIMNLTQASSFPGGSNVVRIEGEALDNPAGARPDAQLPGQGLSPMKN